MDRADDAGLQRLHDLGMPGRDDLAGRGGDNIDFAKAGPGKRQSKEQTDQKRARPACRRDRCFQYFQGGRQELDFRVVLVEGLDPDYARIADLSGGGLDL
jgi:hypothetical protein